jgi:competence protein ComEA
MNQWLEQHRVMVLGGVGLLIVAGMAVFLVNWQPAATIVIEPPVPTQTPGPIRVYISGAVVNPNVYDLPPGAIVQDVVQMAGGPTADADLDRINLAEPLSDGQHIYVPHVGEVVVQDVQPGTDNATSGLVNINTAMQEQLESLPGIGPVIAQRIIEYREANGPFGVIEDIMNVPGIGPATFEDIRDLITV